MADENDLNINIGINPAGSQSGARQVNAAVGSVVNETKSLDGAFKSLKSAIDPTFAAQEKYNRSLAEYDRLLSSGKISQQEYASAMSVITRAYESQMAAINANGVAAKQAAAAQAAAALQEARSREAAAANNIRLANEWLATERTNTQNIKQELSARLLAERAAIQQAVTAAKQGAAEKVAAERSGGGAVTKTVEQQRIREAAAAAKQAAKERFEAEHAADAAIVADYQQSYATAKVIVQEAARDAVEAARVRAAAERAEIEALAAVEKAQRREMAQAARNAAIIASDAAKQRANAEREAKRATDEQRRAIEEAAIASKREADAVTALRASIDPVYAAQARYNETMAKATQLLMANKLQQGEWTRIQKQAQIQMDINARSMGRMNQVGVQLGYQMQDVTASVASGINPLIIFAQQSGQVAYAMQGMGGTAGRVAQIMGGVWFQAFALGILLLYKYFEANTKAEKSTKDVMVAEDRRKMSLKDLTQALMDYTKAQDEANRSTLAGNAIEQQQTKFTQDEIIKKMTTALKEQTNAQREYDSAVASSGAQDPADAAASQAVAWARLALAQQKVKGLQTEYNEAVKAQAAAAAQQAQYMSGLSEQETREIQEKDALYGAFQRDYIAAAGNQAKQVQLQIQYQKELTEVTDRYKVLKKKEADEERQQLQIETGLYKSRLDAIKTAAAALQKQGFSINPNHDDPKKIGNHPGMGNTAHADHALDINIPGFGSGNPEAGNGVARKKMDSMVRTYQAAGFKVLWNGKVYNPYGQGASYDIPAAQHQHKDHAHLEAPEDLVGQPKGMGLAKGIAAAEEKAIRDLETTEQRAAQALAEAIDTKEAVLAEDDTKTNEEKLVAIRKMEEERVKVIIDAYGEESKQAESAKQHQLAVTKRYNDLMIREEENKIKRSEALWSIDEGRRSASDQNKTGMKSDSLDFLSSNGLITEKQELSQRREILNQEYQDQVAHEMAINRIKMNALEAALDIPGQEKSRLDEINNQILEAKAQHLSQMQGLEEQHARQVARIQRQQATVSIRAWSQVTTTITSSLSSNLQQMWMKQQTIGGALLNMADQIAFKFIDMGVQMLANWVKTQLGMTAVHATQKGVQATADATAAATTAAVGAAERVAQVVGLSAVAGAAAFASTAAIPIVGPVLAPGAAAAATAAVAAMAPLAAAAGGWGEVPADGMMTQLHKKEMVLPAWIASPLRDSLRAPSRGSPMGGTAGNQSPLSGGSGGGADHTSISINAVDARSIERMLKRNPRSVSRGLRSIARDNFRGGRS